MLDLDEFADPSSFGYDDNTWRDEYLEKSLTKWLDIAKNISMRVQASIDGWVVLDESGDAWFFPGSEKPEKKEGEWIGFSPISVKIGHPLSEDEIEILKKTPKFITLTS